jgi:radical SAM superfamily enzyme YgiQ (UPF0313 family)
MDLSIGIVTLNAKYIHASLSLRSLRNAARRAGHGNVWIQEFTINQPLWKIAAAILDRKPDVLGLSIYIWNREQSFDLIDRLKKQRPGLSIVIGGPEVSFEQELLEDYIQIAGEGEKKWTEYLGYRQRGETPSRQTRERWNRYGEDLPELVPAYTEEDAESVRGRIAYLETSRGCPYLCSFCLSARDKSVRYFDDKAQEKQIELLARTGARCVKFVDRTFNLKPARMQRLMIWLARFEELTFHFEVVGDLLTDELLDFLESVPPGRFQFEIGIQTTKHETQGSIDRKQDNSRLFAALGRLVRQNRIHFHCDLIFGLPGETLEDCLKSFREVVAIRPHELQLGFLKFLPGAPIRTLIESHDYKHQARPPYEVLAHRDLSAGELIHLKKFTEVFDLFYNSRRFRFSLDHLLETQDPVDVFERLLEAVEARDGLFKALSLDEQYRVLSETFALGTAPLTLDLLKLDYLYAQRAYRLPGFLRNGQPAPATWSQDRRTPVIAFSHTIEIENGRARLTPQAAPRHYAIEHPENAAGYLREPAVHPAGV